MFAYRCILASTLKYLKNVNRFIDKIRSRFRTYLINSVVLDAFVLRNPQLMANPQHNFCRKRCII